MQNARNECLRPSRHLKSKFKCYSGCLQLSRLFEQVGAFAAALQGKHKLNWPDIGHLACCLLGSLSQAKLGSMNVIMIRWFTISRIFGEKESALKASRRLLAGIPGRARIRSSDAWIEREGLAC